MELPLSEPNKFPYEIILLILDLIQETSESEKKAFVDLLSCCMLCTTWCACALPHITQRLDSLDLGGHSIPDLHRIAAIIQESGKMFPELGRQVKKLIVHFDDMLENDQRVSNGEKIIDDEHNNHTFKRDVAQAIIEVVTSAFALEDLTLDFGGATCSQCLSDTGETFLFVSQKLKRLVCRNLSRNTTDDRMIYDRDPVTIILANHSTLKAISFEKYDGTDHIIDALRHCTNLQSACFDGVKWFSPKLIASELLPAWKDLHTFSFSAPNDRLHPVIESLKKNCPLLTDLSLCANHKDDEELVFSLYTLLKLRHEQFTSLSIKRWSRASEDTFLIFLCDTLKYIKRLDISGGFSFIGEHVKAVQWHDIQYLDMTGCYNVRSKFVYIILKDCRKLVDWRMAVSTWREPDVLTDIEKAGFTRGAYNEWNYGTVWTRKFLSQE